MTHINSALNLLHAVRASTDAIGVAVSFGKDSLATLDLCCRVFDRVEGFYLFRVRDMGIVKHWCDCVSDRYGVQVRQYPHFDLSRCYRHSVLQPHWANAREAPAIKMADIENAFRADAGVDWIAYGWRRSDSFSRALIMKQCAGYDDRARRCFPLRAFKRGDVYDYLRRRRIELPPSFGRKEQGGLDFHPEAIKTLREQYPADYARWVADFPFSEVPGLATTTDDPASESDDQTSPDRRASSTTAPMRKERRQRD